MAMREMFEDEAARKEIAATGIDHAYDFTHQIIGTRMKEILDGQRKVSIPDWAVEKRQQHDRQGFRKV